MKTYMNISSCAHMLMPIAYRGSHMLLNYVTAYLQKHIYSQDRIWVQHEKMTHIQSCMHGIIACGSCYFILELRVLNALWFRLLYRF